MLVRQLLLSEPDEVKWKPANLRGTALGDILVIWYASNYDSSFSGYIYCHSVLQCNTGIVGKVRILILMAKCIGTLS